MKALLIFSVLFAQTTMAQLPDSLPLQTKKGKFSEWLGDVLWSDSEGGFYVGPVGSHELKQFAAGGEIKVYASYYDKLLSNSLYVNVRHLYANDPAIPQTAVGVGAHFSILGLEASGYFGGPNTLWYLTPKVGLDWGNLSIFYGYGLRLGHYDLPRSYSHSISVKYAFYLGAFGL